MFHQAEDSARQMLVSEVGYDVPPQDLRIDLTRMPAIPASRFLISHVRAKHEKQRKAPDAAQTADRPVR